MNISLENDQEKVVINEQLEQLLCLSLEAVARRHGLDEAVAVDVTLVDDQEIHSLNREYRSIDRPTDVLSFALDEDGGEPKLYGCPALHLLGDIVISMETAARQAEEFGHSLERETAYLAVHGLLHLLGYDHMEEEDRAIMREKEEEALREIKLSEEFLKL